MLEIRLNNGRLDLIGDEVIALTYAVNDIASIETRQGVSTNEFNLPVTDNNLKLLGYPTLFNLNQNVSPFTKIDAEIYEDELRIAKGLLQIKNPSLQDQVIPVSFFGENSDVFSRIKGKSIRDLDFTEFNHVFQPSTIIDSFTNTEGYKYELIDRNGLNFLVGDDIPCQAFTLCIYQSTIAKKIIESIGFKIDGNLLEDVLYKNTLIVDTNERFFSLGNDRNRVASLGINNAITVLAGNEDTVIFEESDALSTVGDNYNLTTGEYTVDTDYFAEGSSNLFIRNDSAGSTDVTLRYKLNGTTVSSDTNTLPAGNSTILSVFIGDTFINNANYSSFSEGDVITITLETTTEDVEIQPTLVTNIGFGDQLSSIFNLQTNNVAIEGFSIQPQAVLPDIDQAEFIKEFVFDHNALITVNLNTKTIRFDKKKYNYSNFLDWSNKIDLSEDVQIDYTDIASNYNKINDIRRAETDGVFIKEYNSKERVDFGDGQFNITNDFLPTRGNIFESKFGATYSVDSLDATLTIPYVIGEDISDVAPVKNFTSGNIVVGEDADFEDFIDVAANSVWVLLTQADSSTGAYAVSAITKDDANNEYTVFVNKDLTGTSQGNVRLIYRNEEATPRKVIDSGVFDVEDITDNRTSFNVVSTLTNPEDSENTTSIPYSYFWNPIKGNATDNTLQSLSYGNINIPSRCSNLTSDYYRQTIQQLQSGKVLKASFRITQLDIFNLDFTKLIYLNFTLNGQTISGYFILNKIEEYTGRDDSTVVELIKYG